MLRPGRRQIAHKRRPLRVQAWHNNLSYPGNNSPGKIFSIASWNGEHFKDDLTRVGKVIDFVKAQNPDVFGLYEVEGEPNAERRQRHVLRFGVLDN